MNRRWILGAVAAATSLTACSPKQVATWAEWHKDDPVAAEAFVENDCGALCTNDANHDGKVDRPAKPAKSTEQQTASVDNPPASSGGSSASSNGRCVGYEGLLAAHSPGWDVDHMSRIMYRESRCNPGAYNASGATGLLQVLKSHCGWLSSRVGPCNLTSADYNIRAAAALWSNGGDRHWAQTR